MHVYKPESVSETVFNVAFHISYIDSHTHMHAYHITYNKLIFEAPETTYITTNDGGYKVP